MSKYSHVKTFGDEWDNKIIWSVTRESPNFTPALYTPAFFRYISLIFHFSPAVNKCYPFYAGPYYTACQKITPIRVGVK